MSARRPSRSFGTGLDELTETYVVTILVLTERFSDGADLRDAFFAVFPRADEDDFLNSCFLALQVLSPERTLG